MIHSWQQGSSRTLWALESIALITLEKLTLFGQRLTLVNATMHERTLENEMERERRIDTKFSLLVISGKLSNVCTNPADLSCHSALLQGSGTVAIGSVLSILRKWDVGCPQSMVHMNTGDGDQRKHNTSWTQEGPCLFHYKCLEVNDTHNPFSFLLPNRQLKVVLRIPTPETTWVSVSALPITIFMLSSNSLTFSDFNLLIY